MFLIFTLGRTDVLPVADYGVRNGFTKVYRRKEMPTPKELEKIGAKWAPFRSAAAWYFWRALELQEFQTSKKIKSKKLPLKIKSKKQAVTLTATLKRAAL